MLCYMNISHVTGLEFKLNPKYYAYILTIYHFTMLNFKLMKLSYLQTSSILVDWAAHKKQVQNIYFPSALLYSNNVYFVAVLITS